MGSSPIIHSKFLTYFKIFYMIKTSNVILVNRFFLPYNKVKLSVDEQIYVKLHLDQPILIV